MAAEPAGPGNREAGDLRYDVLCYGTISLENVTHLSQLPTPRRDATATHEYDDLGGEALNVAVPLAEWGLRVAVVGNFIGTDRKAEFIRAKLARHPRIDTRYITQHPNLITPFTRVLVTPDGERSRIAYWFDDVPKDELLSSVMAQARVLSVDAYGKDERDRAARIARELGKTVITADAIWPQYPLASYSDVVIISSSWLQTNFPGVFDYDHALDLQSRGAGAVIITDGDKPVLVVRADGSPFGIEPYKTRRVLDTSGAGDLFKAGIIYGWLQPEWSLEQKVKFGCAAAALNCERDRSKMPPPSLADILALMRARSRGKRSHESTCLEPHLMSSSVIISRNGVMIPAAAATISVFNPAIYGSYGVYESIQVAGGVVFEQDAHLRRLAHSARIIELALPADLPAIGGWIAGVVAAHGPQDCTIRLFVVGPDNGGETAAYIWAQAPAVYPQAFYTGGVDAITFEARRYLPQAKSLNTLASHLAQRRARAAGVHEAFLYHDGCLTEGSNSNLFAVMNDAVLTPPASEVLSGVTRDTVIALARQNGLPLREIPLPLDEIKSWDECFITSTSRHVMPVTRLDGQPIGAGKVGPVTQRLAALFEEFFAARVGREV